MGVTAHRRVRHRRPGPHVGDACCSRRTATPPATLVSNGRIDARRSRSRARRGRTTTCAPAAASSTTRAGACTEAPSDTYVSGSRRQAWSYQAGPAFGPPFTTADGPDELRYATAPMTQNMAIVGPITATLFVSATTRRHRAVRAADRRGTRRQPHVPAARHAEGEPPGDRHDEERLRAAACCTGRGARTRTRSSITPRRGVRVPRRGVPGRARVPARPPAAGEDQRAAGRSTASTPTCRRRRRASTRVFHTPAQPSRITLPIVPLHGRGARARARRAAPRRPCAASPRRTAEPGRRVREGSAGAPRARRWACRRPLGGPTLARHATDRRPDARRARAAHCGGAAGVIALLALTMRDARRGSRTRSAARRSPATSARTAAGAARPAAATRPATRAGRRSPASSGRSRARGRRFTGGAAQRRAARPPRLGPHPRRAAAAT